MENSGLSAPSNTNGSPLLSSNTTQQNGGQNFLTPPSESRHLPSLLQPSDNELGHDFQVTPNWLTTEELEVQEAFRHIEYVRNLIRTALSPPPSGQVNEAVSSESASQQVPCPAMGNPPHNQGTGHNLCPGCANCNLRTQRNQPDNHRCSSCNNRLIRGICPNSQCHDPSGFFLEDRWHVQQQASLHPLPATNTTNEDDQFTGASGSGRQQRAFLYRLLGLNSITR